MNKRPVFAVAILLLLVTGSYSAYKFFGGESAQGKTIGSYNNIVINIAAEESGLSPEQIKDIVDKALPRSEYDRNTKDSIRVISAARKCGPFLLPVHRFIHFSKPNE